MANGYKYYADLPSWAKGVIAVSGLAAIGFIGYKIYKKFQLNAAETAIKNVNQDIKNLSKSESPSFIQSQYNSYADSLFEAMSGTGTDEKEIYNVFRKMINTVDVLMLVKAFGIRDYTDDKLFVFNIKPMDLNQWISAELSSTEKQELNKILTNKKIKYQF